jgi:filamentous hemagglutinin
MTGSASRSRISSDYASVLEPSAIIAGDGGFQINVQNATALRGASILSSQNAADRGKNTLRTATLIASDIQNHAGARADSSGFGLSSDMFAQGKYGVAKAGASNLLLNASESESASGVTHAAISDGRIEITDEDRQRALTGQTAGQGIASLNRDTVSAHQAVERPDADALAEKAQTGQAIKTALYNETVRFTDEAYRTMFLKKARMYLVKKEAENKISKRELSDEEKLNLRPGADGKVHIAGNGITIWTRRRNTRSSTAPPVTTRNI